MNQNGHELFQRWARDRRSYVAGFDLGYGGTVTAQVLEGKGSILPGQPKGGGRKKTEVDELAMSVEKFVARLNGGSRKVLEVFYLEEHRTTGEKARELGIGVRTMYSRLELLQIQVVEVIYGSIEGD